MKKKTINKLTLLTAVGLGAVVLLASCTANLCTDKDKARIMYTYDTGTLRFVEKQEDVPTGVLSGKLNDHVYYYQGVYDELTDSKYPTDYVGDESQTLTDVIVSAKTSRIVTPSDEFWFRMDELTLNEAIDQYTRDYKNERGEDPIARENLTVEQITGKYDDPEKKTGYHPGVLADYGYVKFAGLYDNEAKTRDMTTWKQWETWNESLRSELGVDNAANPDFINLYKTYVNAKVSNVRSCITIGVGDFGNFGNHHKIIMDKITWGDAWKRGGLIEGLLIWPIAALTESLSHAFGMNGVGQLGAILLVTFIVRTFLLLVSFKSTIGQQKMQMLQPELSKIQAKYPNADSNQAQKQRMSQEQMALYKKNKINPIGSLLVLIVQFPIFIGVWGAMQGSAALATDKVMELYLSDSIWNTLRATAGWPNNLGWWAAFILIILMSVAQFVAMKLPQWMQKAREKKHPQPKLSANPAQNKTQKQMKWFGYIMLVFIIIMGFTLPAGMGVYWFAGALFSIVQTIVTQIIISHQMKKKREKYENI